jgi:hypothetical protein
MTLEVADVMLEDAHARGNPEIIGFDVEEFQKFAEKVLARRR